MARRVGPSARSRRLAQSLRKIRTENGASAAEVGKALGMSGSKLNRIETCEIGIYLDDLEKLLDFYQVAKLRRVELLDIARHAEQRNWLRTRNAHFPADWQTWSDFEDEATALREYEPLVIPGLLQTPEYTREVIRATGEGLSDAQVEQLVESRMSRCGLLYRASAVELHAIVEETALTRSFGGPECLGRQLRHLAEEAARPNVTLQVMPTDVGLHPALAGAFIFIEYDDEPSLVWLEQMVSSVVLEEEEHVAIYTKTWGQLASLALSVDESAAKLRAMAVQCDRSA